MFGLVFVPWPTPTAADFSPPQLPVLPPVREKAPHSPAFTSYRVPPLPATNPVTALCLFSEFLSGSLNPPVKDVLSSLPPRSFLSTHRPPWSSDGPPYPTYRHFTRFSLSYLPPPLGRVGSGDPLSITFPPPPPLSGPPPQPKPLLSFISSPFHVSTPHGIDHLLHISLPPEVFPSTLLTPF